MKWEYRATVFYAKANDPEAKAYLQKIWPGWEPPLHAPQALGPKLNDYGAEGWELVSMQPVHLDSDASVLIHGGPTAAHDDAITGMIKARARIPSSPPGQEPTRYTNAYLCVFKRPVE
ncbi:MAG: DUF4177 domain-containing protein [Actinobacteria bacterium]|nr:DUF4177 domain-containing protein [Actinomycetota bacterium]